MYLLKIHEEDAESKNLRRVSGGFWRSYFSRRSFYVHEHKGILCAFSECGDQINAGREIIAVILCCVPL